MKKLEELGISPAPWKAKQDSGYDRETGDFNTGDTVRDSTGKVIADWLNGETYGEVHPNAEADARLIAAAPELYECLLEAQLEFCRKCSASRDDRRELCDQCIVADWKDALAKASGEREVTND